MGLENTIRAIAGAFILGSLALGHFVKSELVLVHGICWRQSSAVGVHQVVFDGADFEKHCLSHQNHAHELTTPS